MTPTDVTIHVKAPRFSNEQLVLSAHSKRDGAISKPIFKMNPHSDMFDWLEESLQYARDVASSRHEQAIDYIFVVDDDGVGGGLSDVMKRRGYQVA